MTMTEPLQAKTMQAAFETRDASYDGRFVVAVTTTGVYCRPTCPARRPKPENIRFFTCTSGAREAGFRPCKRCKPDDVARDQLAVERAIAAIEVAEEKVTLDHLAEVTGYSATHFQRIFKRLVGLSPAAFQRALRAQKAEVALRSEPDITGAIYAAGFSGPSRFYSDMKDRLGMTPSAWKEGGRGVTIHWGQVETSLGPMVVAATDKGVCDLSFNKGPEKLKAQFPNAELIEGGESFDSLLAEVVDVVEDPGRSHAIPIDVRGTAFQEAVWRELRKIPPGETRSYAEIAAAAGNPKAVRATGSANGANHVPVLIPCHRVVRSDGSIGGYAYGPDMKRELLRREAATRKRA